MELLKYPEAAKKLHLSPVTLRRYVMEKKIPHIKISNRVFFDPRELEEYLENCRVPAESQK